MLSKNYIFFKFTFFWLFSYNSENWNSPKFFLFLCFRKLLAEFEKWKNVLFFRNFNYKLKILFFRKTLRVFHLFFSDVFIFLCFHFFMFSFLQMFSSVTIVNSIFSLFVTVSQVLCFCVVVLRVLWIWESVFLLSGIFLPYTPYWFYQGFHGASSSFLKVAGLPTDARNKYPTHLFCLNLTVFGNYVINREICLNLSKYVDKLLVGKCVVNFKHFNWKYYHLMDYF